MTQSATAGMAQPRWPRPEWCMLVLRFTSCPPAWWPAILSALKFCFCCFEWTLINKSLFTTENIFNSSLSKKLFVVTQLKLNYCLTILLPELNVLSTFLQRLVLIFISSCAVFYNARIWTSVNFIAQLSAFISDLERFSVHKMAERCSEVW